MMELVQVEELLHRKQGGLADAWSRQHGKSMEKEVWALETMRRGDV